MVRAKFRVTNLQQAASNHGATGGQKQFDTVYMSPVMDDENKSWSAATPSGGIQMSINNPAAFDQFKLGECYFVDFTPAPAKESDEAK